MARVPAGGPIVLALVALAIGLGPAVPASGQKAWDQETVTSLAAQLSRATGDLRNTVRREPHIQDAMEHGDGYAMGFWDAIDGLDRSARQLAARAKKGGGYEQTFPIARKMRTQVRDAETAGARLMSSQFMDRRIAPVQALLAKLEPYFF